MITISRFSIALFCLIILATSCRKGYLDRFPLDGPSASSFYTNQDELMMGLMGCYSAINFNGGGAGVEAGGPWPLLLETCTDLSWQRIGNDLQRLGNGTHNTDNGFSLGFWTNFYKGIARCNFLLDNAHNLEGVVDNAILRQTIAEARFLRAIQYHYLIELFGDVPLITNTQSLDEAQVPRDSKSAVVDFIIDELTVIESDLPLNQEIQNNGRATKGAALGYLARTALFNERWDVAATAAKKVMDLGKYKIEPEYSDIFRYEGKANQETILSLQYIRPQVTHTTTRTQGPRLIGGVSTVVPFQSTVDAYDMIDGLPIDQSSLYMPNQPFTNRDPRLDYSIALPGTVVMGYLFQPHRDSLQTWNYNTNPATRVSNTDATNAFATFSGYLWRKYLDEADRDYIRSSQLDVILMRFAEILLIYAEAKVEMNSIDESVYEAINTVRARASVNMPAIVTGKTQNELRIIIRKERRVEFGNEGLRIFDIRRWKIAEKVMSGPFYGKPPKALIAAAPILDEDGHPNYSLVPNFSDMRVIENKIFDKNRDYLWPIPNIEVLSNKNMVQNPGY